MLFAPSAKHAPAALQPPQLTPLQHHLKELQPSAGRQATAASASVFVNGNGGGDEVTKVEQSARNPSKTKEIVEAMMKLDAKLVAYLAGDNDMSCKDNGNGEPLAFESLTAEPLSFECERECEREREREGECESDRECDSAGDTVTEECLLEQKLEVFKRIAAVKLQMEALTLQPEGTKRMELLQSEIRPIFTVECQLSHELIKNVPRYDMFHIMQFESEKFQSLTQCTRFGQEAQREVKLQLTNDTSDDEGKNGAQVKPNLGRIHFTVWWREPGTCLNEMLGMGVLELEELYSASLLEQCKRIMISRRGVHLASMYLKISLPLQRYTEQKDVAQLRELLEKTSIKQCNGNDNVTNNNSGDETGENKQGSGEQGCQNADSGKATSVTNPTVAAEAAAGDETNTAQNNNSSIVEVESSNFTAETSKVRLLKGYIYANETRNVEMNANRDYFLVCRRFWNDEAAITVAGEERKFNYQEQFAVINDEKFLKRVDKQHLQLEVWQRVRRAAVDGNGNASITTNEVLEPIGTVQLPLHQFFIAYRDEAITNHLCKGKLPVISVDAWTPIVNYYNRASGEQANVGELKCLLAIGSEEQIAHLKEERGYVLNASPQNDDLKILIPHCLQPKAGAAVVATTSTQDSAQLKKTADLIDMLQQALKVPQSRAPSSTVTAAAKTTGGGTAAAPLKPLQTQSFKFGLEILRATGLPLNPSPKGKKAAKRNANALVFKRFPPNEAPSTYVTFQADDCQAAKTFKSHEGSVYASNIVEKSTHPVWQQHFRIAASVDYLKNAQKRFILKIWKKAANDAGQLRLQPNPMDDAIIGFAALDLTMFMRGLQIGGWFNIVDFNGRINGQLEMRCQPLEDVHKILQLPPAGMPVSSPMWADSTPSSSSSSASMDAVIDQFESSLDLTHLNLGQAIKRKFTELEEISQRLRTRLVDVTGEQLSGTNFDISALDSWQPFDSAVGNVDTELDDFERDINTAPAAAQSVAVDATAIANDDAELISSAEPTQESVGKTADKNNPTSE